MYIYYNANRDGERTGDCTIRAITAATGESWDAVYWGLALEANKRGRMMEDNPVWGAYLRQHGFERRAIPDTCPDCYTVRDFAADHPNGSYILALSGHVVYLHDGNWYDTWDSGNETVLYYWQRRD